MSKKNVVAAVLLCCIIVVIPYVQSFVFVRQTDGKITVNEPIDAKYLQNGTKAYSLVFFGYVGCTHVCTPVLKNLNDIYASDGFSQLKPYVDLTFVNLRPEVQEEQPDQFAKSFNTNFKGVYLTQKQLMNIDRDLNVYFSQKLDDSTELDHSDHVYLIKHERNGLLTLLNIYTTHPFNKAMLITDLSGYIKGDQ